MSSSATPERETPHGRLLVVSVAAVVTVVTVAGGLGFGPGAPVATTPLRDVAATAPLSADPPETDGSNGWLTVDHSPTEREPSDDADPSVDDTALPDRSGEGKRVVYDISAQRVWLVTGKDNVARTYLVSGARDETKVQPDTYEVYSKSPDAISYNSEQTMNYMVRFTTGDRAAIGFHDVPELPDGTLAQSKADLGTPMSAGCIRQWVTDARALWRFAPVGTNVVVTA